MIVVGDKEKTTIKNIEKLDVDGLKAAMIYTQGLTAALVLLTEHKEEKSA